MKDQRQEAGDSSNLYQGQSVEVHNHGPTIQEVRDIAKGVFYENYLVLSDRAMAEVRDRINEFTDLLLTKLFTSPPENVEEFDTPRMLAATYKAQKQYAESGDRELAEILADILVAMSGAESRSLEDIILNQAVEVAGKLTPNQINGVATIVSLLLIDLKEYPSTVTALFDFVDELVKPYYGHIPVKSAEYRYMSALGVISELPSPLDPFEMLTAHNPGLFVKGFTLDSLPAELKIYTMPPHDGGEYFEEHPDHPKFFRVKLPIVRLIRERQRANRLDSPPYTFLEQFVTRYALGSRQIRTLCHRHKPELATFLDTLANSRAVDFRPSSVGIAIGHAAMRRRLPSISLDDLLH
ncbi:hypothetical protein OG921_10535 [Aldersonia sp. NBC_00410]|uniref:LPO_1073/Vpar_1526 family protein n=1 Tax=Aldersonia sp. NBC_00410 TaxID=2975954 RepID=UPI0022594EB2|nr:LPO_1073/Vpar_1526 family protein [Aldersonia sp. NBC_00410]MCX5043601.1 hypothetical protein [Aldersonia sp. NBC_00410]